MAKVLLIRSAPVTKSVNNRQGRNVRKISAELEGRFNNLSIPLTVRDVTANPPSLEPEDVQQIAQEVLLADAIVLECPIFVYGVPFPLRVWMSALKRSGRMQHQSAVRAYSALKTKTVIFLESISEMYECMLKQIAAEHLADLQNKWKELGVERFESVSLVLDSGMTELEETQRWNQCAQDIADLVKKLQWRWNRNTA